jgi:hypothetical protein
MRFQFDLQFSFRLTSRLTSAKRCGPFDDLNSRTGDESSLSLREAASAPQLWLIGQAYCPLKQP